MLKIFNVYFISTVDTLLRIMQRFCFIHLCNYYDMIHDENMIHVFLFAELVEEFEVFEGWSNALLVRVGKEFMWREFTA